MASYSDPIQAAHQRDRRRAMAEALMQSNQANTGFQALTSGINQVLGNIQQGRLDKEYARRDADYRKALAGLVAGGDMEQAIASNPDLAAQLGPTLLEAQIKQRFLESKPREGFTLGEGQQRFDAEGRVLATGPARVEKPQSTPAEIQQYEYAKGQGYRGTLFDFKRDIAAAGAGASAAASAQYRDPVPVPDPKNPGQFIYDRPRIGMVAPTPASAASQAKPSGEENKAASLAVRLERALKDMQDVESTNPAASKPEILPSVLPDFLGIANMATSPDRQRAENAQLDALDAALTLSTGAAYTREQLKGLSKSYFPQIGDDNRTIEEKRRRLNTVIESARISAGRAAPAIDKAIEAGQGAPSGFKVLRKK